MGDQFSGGGGGGNTNTSSTPVFSTVIAALTTSTSLNTVLSGPTTMFTPTADGTFRLTAEIIQTTAGNTGTCTLGGVGISLGYTNPDSGVTYTVGTTTNGQWRAINATGVAGSASVLAGVANGAANNFFLVPIEFRAKAGTAISFQLFQSIANNCTNPPVITARIALYGPLGY